MKESTTARMGSNLRRAIVWLALGAVAVALIELVWDYATAGSRTYAQSSPSGDSILGERGYSAEDFAGYAFREEALGRGELPRGFVEECFDPYSFGEVNCSEGGDVVGIVSDWDADTLLVECSEGLLSHGWSRTESGQERRCTFSKADGSLHWLFLDVVQVADSGVAVLVMEDPL